MELSKETLKYWMEEDWKDLDAADSYADMYAVAERVFSRMPQNLSQVCGPIGTGGLGSIEANLHAFNEEVKKLQEQGIHVFDQMPFESPMQKLKKILKPGEYAEAILTDFYLPIFNNTQVTTFYFMPNWQTSKGAQWEHELAKQLGKEIKYL